MEKIMRDKLNGVKGKIVRGIRADVSPDFGEEEKTRIIEKIMQGYTDVFPVTAETHFDFVVSIIHHHNAKNGWHRIRIEAYELDKYGTRTVISGINHKIILKRLQASGMSHVGLLQDDVIFYSVSEE